MISRSLLLGTVLFLSLFNRLNAEDRVIVRVQGGAPVIESACRLLRCNLLRSLGDPLGQVFVVSLDSVTPLVRLLNGVLSSSLLLSIEPDLPSSVLRPVLLSSGAPAGLRDTRRVPLDGVPVWNGYANQSAAAVVRTDFAQAAFKLLGDGTVAIIDTGVDPTHPALSRVLLPGYDFTRNRQGASELADVNQSTTAVVDDGGRLVPVNGMMVAGLNQSTTAVVDDPRNRAFGHGTMVAGIVHLVAPRSLILPLKAFAPDGTGYASDIIRAVYFAVSNNARVISMSFSMAAESRELASALSYAVKRQVICVSSAGNDGRKASMYPASLDTVIGVGSTDLFDRRSSFSNYGDSLVWIAAPGEQIISTYPYGTYAAASGTSFSTPFVSGAAALLVDALPSVNHGVAANAIGAGKAVGQELGHGRLDVYQAIRSLLR